MMENNILYKCLYKIISDILEIYDVAIEAFIVGLLVTTHFS